jgi:hypothetical protein
MQYMVSLINSMIPTKVFVRHLKGPVILRTCKYLICLST